MNVPSGGIAEDKSIHRMAIQDCACILTYWTKTNN